MVSIVVLRAFALLPASCVGWHQITATLSYYRCIGGVDGLLQARVDGILVKCAYKITATASQFILLSSVMCF